MYYKDLKGDLRIRLSYKDIEYLKVLAHYRRKTVSECVRDIISEYRRAEGVLYGNKKTYFDNKL